MQCLHAGMKPEACVSSVHAGQFSLLLEGLTSQKQDEAWAILETGVTNMGLGCGGVTL